jgi:HlyD family secretion protein
MMKLSMFPVSWLPSLMVVLTLGIASAEEEAKSAGDAKPASDAKPKVVNISGVFEAVSAHEVSAATEQIKSLKIKRIIPQGSIVTKGQHVVWFETEDVDKQIKDARTNLRLSELTLRDEEFTFEQLGKIQKLDREASDRTLKKAKQSYDNFVQIDHERDVESAQFSLTNAKASLENVMEELKQLEQMYKEDDLTEESEEIVLKRAKQSVENAEFRLRGTEISTARSLKQSIPRSEVENEVALTRAQLAHAKAIRELDTARQRQQIEMGKKRDKFKEEQDDFAELQEERKKLVLKAPAAGVAFHGKLTRGKVSEKPSVLAEGSTATSDQELLTIAQLGKLQIRVDLQEKDLSHVSVGSKGKVTVTADPDRKVTATVKSVSTVPYAGTKFDAVLSVKLPKSDPPIYPGMSCSIEFAAAEDGEDGEDGDDGEESDGKQAARRHQRHSDGGESTLSRGRDAIQSTEGIRPDRRYGVAARGCPAGIVIIACA